MFRQRVQNIKFKGFSKNLILVFLQPIGFHLVTVSIDVKLFLKRIACATTTILVVSGTSTVEYNILLIELMKIQRN